MTAEPPSTKTVCGHVDIDTAAGAAPVGGAATAAPVAGAPAGAVISGCNAARHAADTLAAWPFRQSSAAAPPVDTPEQTAA